MQPIIMQDWITIRGVASTTVIQSQTDWILTAPFQDITFYLDVREATLVTIPVIHLQTAPSRDESLFSNIGALAGINMVGAAAPTVVSFTLAGAATVPVSHWTRWKIVGPAALWDATFRIMAAGNSIG